MCENCENECKKMVYYFDETKRDYVKVSCGSKQEDNTYPVCKKCFEENCEARE